MKKIVLTGGGTAGHVYPALALVDGLKDYEIHYMGGKGMEKDILKKYSNIKYHEIPTVKLERKLTFKNLFIPFKLLKSIKTCKKVLKEISPNIVFSKGGFVSVPVVIAASKQKLPIISHESDLSMGLANKIILHYCSVMCTSFKETSKLNKKCVYTGQPIRDKVFHGRKDKFNLDKSKPTLLVLGGSLGAKFINNLIFENLDELTKHFNILHICGKNNFQKLTHENYVNVPYAEEIGDFYAAADIVMARAGSGVINELLALHKPMLLIPLSKKCSRGDQLENAALFEKLGYAVTITEENAKFNIILENLLKLSKNHEKIAKNMKKTAKNNANSIILEIIKKYEK